MDKTELKKMMTKKTFRALMAKNRVVVDMNTGTRIHKDVRDNRSAAKQDLKRHIDNEEYEL